MHAEEGRIGACGGASRVPRLDWQGTSRRKAVCVGVNGSHREALAEKKRIGSGVGLPHPPPHCSRPQSPLGWQALVLSRWRLRKHACLQ